MLSVFGSFATGLLDLVYPPVCLVCRARIEAGALCNGCASEFGEAPSSVCHQCGLASTAGSGLCSACGAGEAPPFDWCHTLGHYGGSLRTAIHRLKYDGKTGLARPLAHLLSRSMEASSSCLLEPSSRGLPVSFDLVVPVPLHPARLHERGYNQSERIAFYLARERRWPLDTDHLVRVRRTRSQTTLDRAARAANVRGAFAVRDATAFTGKSVLILDDVLTTTATVSEAARALRGAGAARVTVVALAID